MTPLRGREREHQDYTSRPDELGVRALIAAHGHDSEFAARVGSDGKGRIPLVAYAAGVTLAAGRNVFHWASNILEGLESIWTKPLLYSVRGWEDTSV